ncbi:phospholipase A2-like [Nematolebias whitei]|uniref:phospholipase A2-like n=1 Tax=Nematolebias whitei TaxID=451745 RepID=UPI001897AA3C|nr:phospholipase A2-like [Nematolebias whitei]
MIVCTQPDVDPLKYSDYGCYCGFGGGGTPVDEVDKCCQTHDNCYEKSRMTPECNSIIYSPYILVYKYSCSDKQVTCSEANEKCRAAVCECDRAVSQCLAQNKYDPANKNLDAKKRCAKDSH